MDRRIIRVGYSSMVDIMILEPLLDSFIDLYRHDPRALVEVPFEEYKSFILFVLGEKRHLFSDSATLKYLVQQSVTSTNTLSTVALQQNYILDVMSAAAKELHLAESRGKVATLIRFALPKVQQILDLSHTLEVSDEKYRLFYRRLELLGYSMPSNFRYEENKRIAQYIDVCIRMSIANPAIGFLVKGF